MSQNAAPGWYADPQGIPNQQRWWDGSSWTDHTQHAGPQPHSPTNYPAAPPSQEARTWAMIAHLSAIAGAFVALAFIGPLVVYVIKKDEDPFVRQQAAEALNFNLSFLLYTIVFAIVFFITLLIIVGVVLVPVAIAGAIAWLVLIILAAAKANKGEAYRYPLTIRFVN